jgi:O-antigen/teichoic acid export membrane protein
MRKPNLSRNALLNLAGYGLPLVASLGCVPVLLDTLGQARFGFLSLAWALIGYFSLLDLGLGRTLTRFVATRLEPQRLGELPALVAAGQRLLGRLGWIAMALGLGLAPLADILMDLPPELHSEIHWALFILAVSLPATLAVAGNQGVLEGLSHFSILAWLRIGFGLYNFLGATAVALITTDLRALVGSLALGRLAAWWLYHHQVRLALAKICPQDSDRPPPPGGWNRVLIGYGGWLTVSNVIAPLLYYLDRFVLTHLQGLAALTVYSIPQDLLARLALITQSIMGVVFPALVQAATSPAARTELPRLWFKTSLTLLGIMGGFYGSMALLAKPGLTLWLGAEFAVQAAPVIQVLALGYLFSTLAQPPFQLIQAIGKPRTTALVHLAELPLFVVYLWFLTRQFGVLGAAWAWTLRTGLSSLILHGLAWRELRRLTPIQ